MGFMGFALNGPGLFLLFPDKGEKLRTWVMFFLMKSLDLLLLFERGWIWDFLGMTLLALFVRNFELMFSLLNFMKSFEGFYLSVLKLSYSRSTVLDL